MRKFLLLTGLLLLSIFASQVKAEENDFCRLKIIECKIKPSFQEAKKDYLPQFHGQKVCVYYFWGAGCKNCQEIRPLIDSLEKKYQKESEFKKLEIYFDQENRQLFDDFVKRYQVKNPGVPAVFLGDTYLGGKKAIQNHLEEKILEFYPKVEKLVCPLDYKKVVSNVEKPQRLALNLPIIIFAALADSLNPCAFSVLIFLLLYLITLRAQQRILKVGLVYISTVFLSYFLAGLGLLRFIQITSFGLLISRIAAFIAILTGIINIKDYFWYGRGISLRIPKGRRKVIEKYIHQASVPSAFVLGFLVSGFELPCTGGAYLAILSLIAKNKLRAFPLLLLYNLVFVAPLFFILFIVLKGIPPEKIEKWRLAKRRVIRLIIGLVMIGLGVWLLKS